MVGRRELARQAGLAELSERRCDSVLVGVRRLLGAGLDRDGAQPRLDARRARRCRRRSNCSARSPTDAAMLAADTGVDLARLLLDLLIVIVAAKLAAEVAERLRIPAVLGEIARRHPHRPVGARAGSSSTARGASR